MCVDMIDANRLRVLSSGACHMCVDLPIAASQKALPLLQSTHIARRRDVSGVVNVRVTLPHRESRDSYLALLSLYMLQCALTCLMLPCRELSLDSNQLTSLACVTFPASIT